MKNEKDKRLIVSTYDLDKGDFLNEYVLSEKEKELTLLLNGRDYNDGTVEITVSYYKELGSNRSTSCSKRVGTVSLPKGKPAMIHLKFF